MAAESMKDTAVFCEREQVNERRRPIIPSSQVEVRVGGLSHIGKVRTNNEDHFLVAKFGRGLRTLLTNMAHDPLEGGHEEIGYGMVVADGMGGQAAGEVASRSAIQNLVDLVVSTPDWIMGKDESAFDVVMHRMAQRLRLVNDHLVRQAETDPHLLGMGTTLTLACSLGLDLILCHIGDSRAYLFRQDTLQQLTRDMTAAQELVDAGILTPEAAATNRLRHYLTQYLGGVGKDLAQLRHLELQDGDTLLLCSDGLTEMVPNPVIANILREKKEPEDACRTLVDLALHGGGKDNVTVVVAHFRVLS